MNVNMNVTINTTSKKQDITNGSTRSEDFKSVLDNHELKSVKSSKENVQKKYNKDKNLDKTSSKNQRDDVESVDVPKNKVESSNQKDLMDSKDNVELKSKVISRIEEAIARLKKIGSASSSELQGSDNSAEQMAQLQQLLQLLSSMFQNTPEASATLNGEGGASSINLENVLGAEITTPDVKGTLKNNLSEIIAMLEKSSGNDLAPSQITDMLQKLTTVVEDLKGTNFQTLTSNSEDNTIKNNLLKKIMEQSSNATSESIPKDQMQNSSESSKESKFSGNSSSEEKFLNNLLGKDKDEMKISKAVNFMNQFETVKTLDTAKVQAINTVIDKSNFTVDVIKNIKFMEINNIKDLSVKMNPKELGEITIKLTMESGIMKASISAQNKETFNLLNQNFQDISDKLKNMDIKIQSLDINIYEDSTFFDKDSSGKNNSGNKNNNSGTSIGHEEEDISISSNYAIEENQVNKFV